MKPRQQIKPCRWPVTQEFLPITPRQGEIAALYDQLGSGNAVAKRLNLTHSYVYEVLEIVQRKREAQKG